MPRVARLDEATATPVTSARALGPPRWRGQPGRLEVWYATFTDPESGDGFWIHAEVVAPTTGGGARCHGWLAAFPANGPPVLERFGPHPVAAPSPEAGPWCETAANRLEFERWTGGDADASWDLSWKAEAPPLYTFPRWAWERELLPGCQVVAAPIARFDGKVSVDGRSFPLVAARGALSRIYGHGNAARWAWLHADLGEGDVLEVVAAASRNPLLGRLGVRPFVRLRLADQDWPRDPLLASLRFRATIGLPVWEIEGAWRGRRLRATVRLPPERCVALRYEDPNGDTATCTNSERASARIIVDDARQAPRRWDLDGTAHAEVGLRP